MKTHVILMVESIFGSQLGDTYQIKEYNTGDSNDNIVLFPDIKMLLEGKSFKEAEEFLGSNTFILREWSGQGQASMTEIFLARTGLIAIAVYSASELPKGLLTYTVDVGD